MTRAATVLRRVDEWAAAAPANDAEARELALYATNHAELHRQHIRPIIDNLNRRIKKGTYDHGKATKLWGYAADHAAQLYRKEYKMTGGFSPATRRKAAEQIQQHYDDDLEPHQT